MLQIKVLFLVSCAIECLFKESSVFRMRLLNDSREFRRIRRVKFKDPEGLRRPVDRSAGGVPTETARVAHGLRFSQVGLAAPQGLFGALTLTVLLLAFHRSTFELASSTMSLARPSITAFSM